MTDRTADDLLCQDLRRESQWVERRSEYTARKMRQAADRIADLQARYAVEVNNHCGCLDSHEWAMERIEDLETALRRIVASGAYPEAAIAAEALDGAP